VSALAVFVMHITGTIHFLYSLEYIVRICFPSPYDQSLFFMDFMYTFVIWGVHVSLGAVVLHFVLVRLRVRFNSKQSVKNDSDATDLGENDQQPCIEIKEIKDETSRYGSENLRGKIYGLNLFCLYCVQVVTLDITVHKLKNDTIQAMKRPRTRSAAARQVSNAHERDLGTNQNV